VVQATDKHAGKRLFDFLPLGDAIPLRDGVAFVIKKCHFSFKKRKMAQKLKYL
jgi:hypothetical protein